MVQMGAAHSKEVFLAEDQVADGVKKMPTPTGTTGFLSSFPGFLFIFPLTNRFFWGTRSF